MAVPVDQNPASVFAKRYLRRGNKPHRSICELFIAYPQCVKRKSPASSIGSNGQPPIGTRNTTARLRKPRLGREARALFADATAVPQSSVDEEVACRHVRWGEREHEQCDAQAARWREARIRYPTPLPRRTLMLPQNVSCKS